MFFVDTREICRRICNIELHYVYITLKEGIFILCICDNADMFSPDVLKQLLLTDDGSRSVCAAALSLDVGGLKIRAVSPK